LPQLDKAVSTTTTPTAPAPIGPRPSPFRSLDEIYQEIYENRQFNLNYFLMLVMACLIALLGLLENSPAVIIGAMLISPLMGPILSCGLALTSADWSLAKKALHNLGLSVLETIIIAALATWLMPLKAVTPEILARTNPNLMDLLIAIFSGLAGTLALCSRQSGLTIIPGVAIAVAVMPPLATVGYGISTHQWSIARGAFLLFFTNLMAIVISANVVFFFVGFRSRQQPEGPGRHILFRYRVLLAWLMLIVLSVPLMQTLIGAAQQVALRKDVASSLREHLDHKGKAQLASFDVQRAGKILSVDATVRTAVFIKPEEVREMEEALSSPLSRSVQLNLEQIQLAKNQPPIPPPQPSSENYIAGGVVRPLVATESKQLPGALMADLQQQIERMLVPLLTPLKIDSPTVQSLARANGIITVQVTGRECDRRCPSRSNCRSCAPHGKRTHPRSIDHSTISSAFRESSDPRPDAAKGVSKVVALACRRELCTDGISGVRSRDYSSARDAAEARAQRQSLKHPATGLEP
jgi:uncharacterized hydrophobic protein (TIGR00271 family)